MSGILIYNTLGRRLERFRPSEPPLVNMYTCGPTPYDYTHIGHARTFASFDAIKRYLSLRGYSVFHVQNITDIDDKIIDRASGEGRDWRELVEYYTRDYFEGLESLKIRIDLHPRVTDHISEIVKFVEGLIDKGYAYVAESGSVYYEVDRFPDYGALSGRREKSLWDQEEGFVREKRNPYDFALWKASKPGEPWWESPWGRGRPGWHIECSVMSSKYTGARLDIHGGGVDLVFPHHENERAQSEALLGSKPWVKYWVHVSYLTIRGEKMSKSLGNIIPLKDALKEWGPGPLRMWLLSSHYRSSLDYSEQGLEQARRLYERLRDASQGVVRALKADAVSHRLGREEVEALRELRRISLGWHRDMSRDFNLGAAARWAWEITRLYYKSLANIEAPAVHLYAERVLREMNRVYAFADDVFEGAPPLRGLEEPLLELLVEVRSELRKRRLYDLADSVRDRLSGLGIKLLDYPDRTEYRVEGR